MARHSILVAAALIVQPAAAFVHSGVAVRSTVPSLRTRIVATVPDMLQDMNDVDLAEQIRDLDKQTMRLRDESDLKKFNDAQLLGWCEQAETINGRFSMFFFAVGLLTEYYTGQSVPRQIQTMLEVSGVLPPS
mmetsp:Transcript_1265/g.3538  ORF Transcript_1265/g.3538 Transcript_1265/m.3538 type:complete len:133 (-) Transcript_1265:470-868(-)